MSTLAGASLLDAPIPYVARCWEIPSSQLDMPGHDLADRAESMRLLALAAHAARIQSKMGLDKPPEPGADRRQGARRTIRDLDTGTTYPTATAAALALGVSRAHHVLAACRRQGRAGGHRVSIVPADTVQLEAVASLPIACRTATRDAANRRRVA